jgi:hypothetical protein
MKNVYNKDEIISEYFDRSSRRRPLWKSEAEFNHLLNNYIPLNSRKKIIEIFKKIDSYLQDPIRESSVLPLILDDNAVKKIKEDVKEAVKKYKSSRNKTELLEIKKNKEMLKKWVECIKDFADRKKTEFSFVLAMTNKFKSNFSKIEIDDILIWFPSDGTTDKFKKVSSVLEGEDTPLTEEKEKKEYDKNIFYFFYKKDKKSKLTQKLFFNDLCKKLLAIT